MPSGCDRCPPTDMSFILLPDFRSSTDTVPSASFEMRPLPVPVIAAPYGKRPTRTYFTAFVLRFTIAARSARLSAARSVLPSRETARSRGQEMELEPVGGKLWGAP